MQDSYRKVDVISKAEFDSQRGSEDREMDAEADLVFGPLDEQDDVATAAASKASEQRAAPAEQQEDRAKSSGSQDNDKDKDKDNRERLPSGGRRKKDVKSEKRARFYPVLNKQESPSKVCMLCLRLFV